MNVAKLRKGPQELLTLYGCSIEAGPRRQTLKRINDIRCQKVYRGLIAHRGSRKKFSRNSVERIDLSRKLVGAITNISCLEQPLAGKFSLNAEFPALRLPVIPSCRHEIQVTPDQCREAQARARRLSNAIGKRFKEIRAKGQSVLERR